MMLILLWMDVTGSVLSSISFCIKSKSENLFSTLMYAQHVNLGMNMGFAIIWNGLSFLVSISQMWFTLSENDPTC